MCIIAAPEGLKALEEAHPDIQIYVGHLDRELIKMLISVRDLEMQVTEYSVQNNLSRRKAVFFSLKKASGQARSLMILK